MQNFLKASVFAVLVTLLGSAETFAADPSPTISDAHELIGELIGRSAVSYDAERKYLINNYRGNGCKSSIKGGVYVNQEIDWAAISSISSGGRIVYVYGSVVEIKGDGTSSISVANVYFVPDEITEKRLGKAMAFLMNSCAKKSKFD